MNFRRLNNNLTPKKDRQETPRGYILVNFEAHNSAELRALAQCHWSGFQGVTQRALRDKIKELEYELGITAEQALQMSRQKRRKFANRRSRSLCGISFVGGEAPKN